MGGDAGENGLNGGKVMERLLGGAGGDGARGRGGGGCIDGI